MGGVGSSRGQRQFCRGKAYGVPSICGLIPWSRGQVKGRDVGLARRTDASLGACQSLCWGGRPGGQLEQLLRCSKDVARPSSLGRKWEERHHSEEGWESLRVWAALVYVQNNSEAVDSSVQGVWQKYSQRHRRHFYKQTDPHNLPSDLPQNSAGGGWDLRYQHRRCQKHNVSVGNTTQCSQRASPIG